MVRISPVMSCHLVRFYFDEKDGERPMEQAFIDLDADEADQYEENLIKKSISYTRIDL